MNIILHMYLNHEFRLIKFILDGSNFKILSIKEKSFEGLYNIVTECFPIEDLLVDFVFAGPKRIGEDEWEHSSEKTAKFELLNQDLEVLDELIFRFDFRSGFNSYHIHKNLFVTVGQQGTNEIVLNLAKISRREKKLKLQAKRVLRGLVWKRFMANDKGLCILAFKHSEKEQTSNAFEEYGMIKAYTFNYKFEVGMVIDFGYMNLMEMWGAKYISKHEFHINGIMDAWFSIRYSENLQENPIVTRIKYEKEES